MVEEIVFEMPGVPLLTNKYLLEDDFGPEFLQGHRFSATDDTNTVSSPPPLKMFLLGAPEQFKLC